MKARRGVAVFDLDGTITSRDTFIEFIRYTHGSRRLYLGFLANAWYLLLYALKLYPNHKFKEKIFAHFYAGHKADDLCRQGEAFATEVLPRLCYAGAAEKLAWHRARDHHIVILTASSPIWLRRWCETNGYQLIGTEYRVENDRYCGRMQGANCYGPEKLRRLESEIDLPAFGPSYGYGDSKSDLHFMRRLDRYEMGPLK